MALINCSECGTEVSSNAEKCPKCSNPISGSQPQQAPQAIGEQAPEPPKKRGPLKSCCLLFAGLVVFSMVVTAIKEANMTPEQRKAQAAERAEARADYQKRSAERKANREAGAALEAERARNEAAAARAPDLAVHPSTLVREYDGNEVAADMRYKGKRLQLSGVVDDIGKDFMGTIYVTLMSSHDFRSVQIYFSDAHANRVANLRQGSQITVVGKCTGLMGNVHIKDTDFVD